MVVIVTAAVVAFVPNKFLSVGNAREFGKQAQDETASSLDSSEEAVPAS